ncbi:MAG TPA: class I SAM-dependent methyltransferase [Chloroflexota bacterium]|jgi:SAM-dependent methyltransferase|nr:class I SAM-dependent methyltransferase [Chloroflexota bacterium]
MIDPTRIPLVRETWCPERRNNFSGRTPWHLTPEQISYLPAARQGEWALDLGCGRGIHRELLEALGYRVRSIDYAGDAADERGDAHALPYRDGVFRLVLSIAVLEHLAEPVVALREVRRVLRSDGVLVGTVAFLEPFHDASYFHMTPLGLAKVVADSELKLETVFPIRGWSGPRAQLEMGLGTRVPRWVSRLLAAPANNLLALHDAIRGKRGEARIWSEASRAGAFFFVAWRG